MKLLYVYLFIIFSCSASKETRRSPISEEKKTIGPGFPVWMEFSKSVPDSIRDFLKIYLGTKGKKIIKMEEAIELIFEQEKISLADNLPTGNTSETEFVDRLAKNRKPVCVF